MHSDRLSRGNRDTQATTIPDWESVKTLTLFVRARIQEDATYAVPPQIPWLLEPSMTLQYDPAGKPVANVMPHAVSMLLIATKPSDPV